MNGGSFGWSLVYTCNKLESKSKYFIGFIVYLAWNLCCLPYDRYFCLELFHKLHISWSLGWLSIHQSVHKMRWRIINNLICMNVKIMLPFQWSTRPTKHDLFWYSFFVLFFVVFFFVTDVVYFLVLDLVA